MDRLAAVIALVRAVGLNGGEGNGAELPPTLSDSVAVPAEFRQEVALALARGLLTAEDGAFHPRAPLTRAQLAHAMSVVVEIASE